MKILLGKLYENLFEIILNPDFHEFSRNDFERTMLLLTCYDNSFHLFIKHVRRINHTITLNNNLSARIVIFVHFKRIVSFIG